MWIVAVRGKGEIRWRVICKTYSRPYALRMRLKWLRRGYDVMLEDDQNEDA